MPVASDSFTSVDLSRLPAPSVVEPLDFETIYAASLAQFQALLPEFSATVESDPILKLIEMFSYRELLLRQRVNEAARAVMPAYAIGADLDNLAAIMGIERFILVPANPATGAPAVLESDDDFRRRLVLAPEGFSVAGPEGAYIFHTLSADSDVLDASATSPAPGEVVVTVLSRTGDGTPSPAVLAAVAARLSSGDVRPLTDQVTVQSADVVDFSITAAITFFTGPDSALVLAESQSRLTSWLADARRLGRDITRSGIIAALHAEGAQNVILTQPAADIPLTRLQAGNCTAITINDAGIAE